MSGPEAPLPKSTPAPTTGPGPRPWPEAPKPAAAVSPAPGPRQGEQPPAATPLAPVAVPAPAPATPDARPLLDRVIDTIKTCYDPEIPLNIYDLSLIYGIDVDPESTVHGKMTLTSPACPVAGSLPGEVQQKIAGVPGVRSAHVELVWDPPWDLSRLSEAARLTLGIG